MGLHDILHMLEIQIDSDEAVAFNDNSLSFIRAMQYTLAPFIAKEKVQYL